MFFMAFVIIIFLSARIKITFKTS